MSEYYDMFGWDRNFWWIFFKLTSNLLYLSLLEQRPVGANLHLKGVALIQCGQVFLLERPHVLKNERSSAY